MPFLSASIDGKQSSAWRYLAGAEPSRFDENLVRSARSKPISCCTRDHEGQVVGGVVRLECRRVLRRVVDDGDERRARRLALVARFHRHHADEPAGREVPEVVAHLLEPVGGHSLLRVIQRVEVQLGLAIERRLLAVQGAGELGELGLGEPDLLLLGGHQRQVLLRSSTSRRPRGPWAGCRARSRSPGGRRGAVPRPRRYRPAAPRRACRPACCRPPRGRSRGSATSSETVASGAPG